MPEIVQRLIRHSTGERTITDHGDDMSAVGRLTLVACHRHAVRIRQHGRGVTVFDEIVHALFAAWVSREPAGLPQLREASAPTGHDLVHVSLMPGVPQDGVARRLKHAVQGERQFNRPEV